MLEALFFFSYYEIWVVPRWLSWPKFSVFDSFKLELEFSFTCVCFVRRYTWGNWIILHQITNQCQIRIIWSTQQKVCKINYCNAMMDQTTHYRNKSALLLIVQILFGLFDCPSRAGVIYTYTPYGCTAVQLKCYCRRKKKAFGTDVICILRSQQASQAICNSQCKQTRELFKGSDFNIIGKEMEPDLSRCFSAFFLRH